MYNYVQNIQGQHNAQSGKTIATEKLLIIGPSACSTFVVEVI